MKIEISKEKSIIYTGFLIFATLEILWLLATCIKTNMINIIYTLTIAIMLILLIFEMAFVQIEATLSLSLFLIMLVVILASSCKDPSIAWAFHVYLMPYSILTSLDIVCMILKNKIFFLVKPVRFLFFILFFHTFYTELLPVILQRHI